ncbi:hypothetical protein Mtai_v1c14940 [Meiothermus taiwanensis WR-220]|uniref:Uncharacterized protein n=1 Tax=Meiothermus taiwanensis WR-220 TaxID=1339250 RepID=A0ABM6WI29_9DEIN|nr:hypothetical protein Mtai_v1c14940 [Meiothermus taiwanensis WR-220]
MDKLLKRFQSSLELSPECDSRCNSYGRYGNRFNPHSSFRPSATQAVVWLLLGGVLFQSSLELSPECDKTKGLAKMAKLKFQSSLELSPECDKTKGLAKMAKLKFQSSLELSPECDRPIASTGIQALRFQSSLELSPECDIWQRLAGAVLAKCFNPHSSSRPSATGL